MSGEQEEHLRHFLNHKSRDSLHLLGSAFNRHAAETKKCISLYQLRDDNARKWLFVANGNTSCAPC